MNNYEDLLGLITQNTALELEVFAYGVDEYPTPVQSAQDISELVASLADVKHGGLGLSLKTTDGKVLGIAVKSAIEDPKAAFAISDGETDYNVYLLEKPAKQNSKGVKRTHRFFFGDAEFDVDDLVDIPLPGTDGWTYAPSKAPRYFKDTKALRQHFRTPHLDKSQEIHLSVAPTAWAGKGRWAPTQSTIEQFIHQCLDHKVGKKDGLCFTQGALANKSRMAKAAIQNHIICFDLDTGETAEELDERLAETGLAYVRYSTHSHKTDRSTIKRDAFFEWAELDASKNAPLKKVKTFLRKKKGYRKEIVKSAKIVEDAKPSDDGTLIEVKHKPIEKHRVIFFLNEPFVFQGKGNQKERIKEWRERYHGFGSELGFVYDHSCTDPTRLFYFPRHRKGADYNKRFVDGTTVNLSDFEPLTIGRGNKRGSANKKATRKRYKLGKTDLRGWAKHKAAYLEIEQALQENAPEDVIRDPRSSGSGTHIECPFEDEHSTAGGNGAFVIDASENDEFSEGFVVNCLHNACQDRDRLDFLKRMIELEWLPEEVVTTNNYLEGYEGASDNQDSEDSEEHEDQEDEKTVIDGSWGFGAQFKALVTALSTSDGDPILYCYGSEFARVAQEARTDAAGKRPISIEVCDQNRLMYEANQTVTFVNAHGKKVSVPKPLVNDLRGMREPPFSSLERIVTTPIFSPSGKLLIDQGYNEETACYIDLGVKFPKVSAVPSKEELERAKDLLINDALCDFPFNDMFGFGGQDPNGGQSSLANSLALILQPFCRQLINGSCPGYFIDKPAPATGAGYLADVVYIINEGRRSDGTSISKKEEEINKSIIASLRRGQSLIFFDNINHRVDSGSLAIVLTQDAYTGRLLGKSEEVTLPIRQTMIFAGNNADFSDELIRRLVPIRLDAMTDRPENRTGFKHDPLQEWASNNRPELVWACLTLIQNWIAQGSEKSSHTMASFEEWARTIGGILEAAGIDGFLDNLQAFRSHRNNDANDDQKLMALWYDKFNNEPIKSSQLFATAFEFDEPVVDVPLSGFRDGEKIQSLGIYIKQKLLNKTFVVGGTKVQVIKTDSKGNGVSHWQLMKISQRKSKSDTIFEWD